MLFQIPAIIQSIRTMADGGYRATIDTQELKPEEATLLFSLKGKLGWVLFKENEITKDEIPSDPVPEFSEERSPSKRLKSCLFVYWNSCTNKSTPFQQFYESWIDRKCSEIKDHLPE